MIRGFVPGNIFDFPGTITARMRSGYMYHEK
jgi:hypothetical protein